MKLLVIRFSTLGDMLLTSPLLRCLKKAQPEASIHFLTVDHYRSAVEFNPNIAKLHVLAHSRELMIEELRSEEYDHIIDLQHDELSRQVARALHQKPFSFRQPGFRKALFTRFGINLLPAQHLAEQYFRTVSELGVANDGAGLDYYIKPEEEIRKNDIPAAHYAGYIACAAGSTKLKGNWPVSQWKEFCRQMDHPIILVGAKEDAAAAREIASTDDIKIYNACGKFSLNETADLINKSKLFVGPANNYMHIAAAYKKTQVILAARPSPALGSYPYYGNNFLAGRPQLPFDMLQNKRLENITVDALLAAVRRRL